MYLSIFLYWFYVDGGALSIYVFVSCGPDPFYSLYNIFF